ncbi:MAG: MFS transporter, partial [Chitinophagaceae bacterium]
NRREFQWKRANPLGSLRALKKYPAFTGLITSLVLVYLSAHAVQTTWTYYIMEKFNWNEKMVGYSLGFVGLMIAIVQGGLIRKILPKIGPHRGVYIGLILYSIGYLLFAFATQGWMMFVFIIPFALGGIAGPSIQGIISNEVPANEQGELQGALTSMMSATAIVGPLLMTGLFAYFTKPGAPVNFPGAPFLMGAIFTILSAIFAYKNLKAKRHTHS